MGNRVVLISCASQKLSHRAKAEDIYTSALFNLNLKYAKKLAPDAIFVLSAKHGLLPLEKEIEPYNLTLNNMRTSEIQQWADKVLSQIKEIFSIGDTEFIFLAGEKYRKFLLPHLTNFRVPLKGLGIGKQLQALKRLIA